MIKNIAEGSYGEEMVEDGFHVLKVQHSGSEPELLQREVSKRYIQFHFCLKGAARFGFNQGNYWLDIAEENSLLLYNTKLDLPLYVEIAPGTHMVSIIMTLRKFHTLFSNEANYIPFLTEENREKKYYAQEAITPSVAVVLSQIINYNLHTSVKKLYVKGKVYELISLYFNRTADADAEQCPFLVDEDHVKRIKRAKEIVIAQMAEPPSLADLAKEVGLPLKRLKEGFKQVYGDSVYSFLFDYKMEQARRLLETGQYNVNEIGLRIGYSTASHFIAAFKKKYGTTPKKYVKAMAGGA